MDSFSNSDEEESRFLDALEHISQEPDFASDSPCHNRRWEYDVWVSTLRSVRERRKNFIRWMGFCPDVENPLETFDNREDGVSKGDIDRMMENSGAVLRTSSFEDDFSMRCTSSSWTTDDSDLSRGVGLSEFRNGNGNSICGTQCNLEGMVENERLGRIQITGLNHLLSTEEFENISQCSPSEQQFEKREMELNDNNIPRALDKLKDRCLSKLRSMSCIISRNVKDDNMGTHNFSQVQGTRIRRVKVRHYRRRLKQLSALFTGQDIQAHEGAILTMKFSHDGQYLASAGEDKTVRVWQVLEDERSDTIDIPDVDPSCVYLSVNHLSDLGPLVVDKDKINKSKSLRRTPDSACVIFPPKVFRILEKPLHVFQGHSGEILDLSWSKDNCLLSSSVDKTVRLWKVGVEQCVKVFSHSDFVTCIQFNPVNDDHFISGSIDGKVRIWEISGCHVVDWIESRDIITAVSYRPDGQGGIIGSLTGTCRFFNITDDCLQLETDMCFTSKKKSPCKRITGFQFLPQDPTKLLVTCSDSQVRVLDGVNVIGKYKGMAGLRNGGNQSSASFSADGKHIVSASEDSNIYIWNYIDQKEPNFSQPKVIRSFECFPSDASVAITWSGLKSTKLQNSSTNPLPFSSPTCFSFSQEFFLESGSKVSATWPEEKLPVSSPPPMGKSQYKFFKTCCQSSSDSHAWGLVIVTGGWDGRIRSFHNYGLPTPI